MKYYKTSRNNQRYSSSCAVQKPWGRTVLPPAPRARVVHKIIAADSKLQRLEPSRRNPPRGERQQHESKHSRSEVIIGPSRARRCFVSTRVRSSFALPTKTGLSQKLKEEEEEFAGKGVSWCGVASAQGKVSLWGHGESRPILK